MKTLPRHQKIIMEKLIQTFEWFVKEKYGNNEVIIDLIWLLVDERIELSIIKTVCNCLTKENITSNTYKLYIKNKESVETKVSNNSD